MSEEQVEAVEGEVVDETEPAPEQQVDPTLAIAVREEREHPMQALTTLPSAREWEAMTAMSVQLCNTTFVPDSYRGKPEDTLAAILTGRELGIGPMQSLRDIHMIDGRPAFSAQLMLSKMRAGGVVMLESSANGERAYIKAKRRDTGETGEFEFTIKDAEAAGLTGKRNWKTYTQDMLWARAVSRMARRFGSDLLGGLVYSKEELEDIDEGDYGSYGTSGSGFDATTFDPAKQVLPDAPKGETAGEIAAQLNDWQKVIASDLNWAALLEEASLATMGPKDSWPEDGSREFMKRWANTITKLRELAQTSPLWHDELGLQAGEEGDEIIVQAFEFGFQMTPSLPLPKVEESND